ncbi:condensation domain-containing protein [Amycolatopsis nigrescens]|uniref:condensation domain-containing protein n=1 Tax=Amycolatopsis nigrescens TaxID=381445 RepID=UPI0003744A45|nr:condensation domain-containing protein [Amycolatopsis nigrescens]
MTVPLSIQQDFFCTLDKGDSTGAFGAKHVVASGWRLRGPIDVETLQGALDDVVERHEMLRTSIVRDAQERSQRIHPAAPVKLTLRDLSDTAPEDRDVRAEQFFNEAESAEYHVRELPHLRASLGLLGGNDAMLVLVVHHIAADGWSMRLIIRDLATRYAARQGHPVAELPAVRQYREYVAEQRESVTAAGVHKARAYWREKLSGAEIATIRTDRPSAEAPGVYSDLRFLIGAETTSAMLQVAKTLRSSPFMVLLAAYQLLLREKTGSEDVVAATFSSSRGIESFQDTVGAFLNFVPLRTDLSGCATFTEVVERTRTTCLQAYTHEIPFPLIDEEAPGLMLPSAAPDRDVIGFEVLQFPSALDGAKLGGLEYAELRRRLLSQPVSCDIPDGVLWALDVLPSRETISSLKFDANLFDEDTMWELVHEFDRVLRTAVTDPDAPLP